MLSLMLASLLFFKYDSVVHDDQDRILPSVVISGANSSFSRNAYYVLSSAEEWDAVWCLQTSEHSKTKSTHHIEIDFSKHTVVGLVDISVGKTIKICSAEYVKGQLIVKYMILPNNQMNEEGGAHPYCFIVIPKIDGPVVFLRQERGFFSDRWRLRAIIGNE